MRKTKRKHVDLYIAPKENNLIKKYLELIGKPFFTVLIHIFIGFVFLGSFLRKAKKIKLAKKRKRKIRFRLLPTILAFSLIIFLFAFYFLIFYNLPSPRELVTRNVDVSTKIYDRNGNLLYKIFKDQNRTPITLDQIPMHVRLATLAAEDAEFYSHPGFSIRGITRSIIRNATKGELTGGSTITQQLVKNALLSPEKTIIRKLKEVILSVQTELTFSKDQILEMYLNEVAYGGTTYGIEEASEQYFAKKASDLTLAEAALLAGLPKSPTRYSPFGVTQEISKARQVEILRLMRINGFITPEDEEKAKSQKLVYAQNKVQILAPHFVMYVRQVLVDKYGEEMVAKGGLTVTTTLDWEIQKLAEDAIKSELDKLARLNVTNGASVVLDPVTGEILAMVGSKNYFDTPNEGQVNVTTSLRQPGSSIKVINYAYALSNGWTPASIISDSPVSFSVPNQPTYSPKNYDDKFRGNITLRSALAESRNIPAVKILASYGVSKMIDLGQKMGITTWEDKSRFGLSLTLGGGEVQLLELAQVYATIANQGQRPDLISIKKVMNYKGKILEENESNSKEVLDPRVAYQLIDILKDNIARSPAFGSHSALVVPNHPEVAVKTGTSNNLRDNLTIGFNQKYLVAVWVGNNNNSQMSRIASGITGAAPIWNKIISTLLNNEKPENWAVPDRLISLPCYIKTEWFLKEDVPQKVSCKPLGSPSPVSPASGQILPEAARTRI